MWMMRRKMENTCQNICCCLQLCKCSEQRNNSNEQTYKSSRNLFTFASFSLSTRGLEIAEHLSNNNKRNEKFSLKNVKFNKCWIINSSCIVTVGRNYSKWTTWSNLFFTATALLLPLLSTRNLSGGNLRQSKASVCVTEQGRSRASESSVDFTVQ